MFHSLQPQSPGVGLINLLGLVVNIAASVPALFISTEHQTTHTSLHSYIHLFCGDWSSLSDQTLQWPQSLVVCLVQQSSLHLPTTSRSWRKCSSSFLHSTLQIFENTDIWTLFLWRFKKKLKDIRYFQYQYQCWIFSISTGFQGNCCKCHNCFQSHGPCLSLLLFCVPVQPQSWVTTRHYSVFNLFKISKLLLIFTNYVTFGLLL